jgi:hypothetical protein
MPLGPLGQNEDSDAPGFTELITGTKRSRLVNFFYLAYSAPRRPALAARLLPGAWRSMPALGILFCLALCALMPLLALSTVALVVIEALLDRQQPKDQIASPEHWLVCAHERNRRHCRAGFFA